MLVKLLQPESFQMSTKAVMGGELPSCQKGAKEHWKILSVCFLYFLTRCFVSILFLLMEEQTHFLKTVFSELWRWIKQTALVDSQEKSHPSYPGCWVPQGQWLRFSGVVLQNADFVLLCGIHCLTSSPGDSGPQFETGCYSW